MISKKNIFKYIRIFAFFILVAALSIWAIFAFNKDCSIKDIIEQVKNADFKYIVCAFFAMMGFIVFEGLALSTLVKYLGFRLRITRGTVYSAADIFFSAVTPSASGGQPASAFFMMKDGIPGSQTTVILLVNLIMYSGSLLILGLITFIINFGVFMAYDVLAKVIILTGSLVMLGLCVIFILLVVKEQIVYKTLMFFINFFHKIKIIKNVDKNKEKLNNLIEQYRECSTAIQGNKGVIFRAFIFNIIQRISHTLVTVFIYLALGGSKENIFDVGSIQMLTSLGANSFPIPGGMGVTDYILIRGLKNINDIDVAANFALLSRGMSFYLCLILSIIIVVIGFITIKRKNNE